MSRRGRTTPAEAWRGQNGAQSHFNGWTSQFYHIFAVLSQLLSRGGLTKRAAYRKLGILRLTPIIMDLRSAGLNIEQEFGPEGETYRCVGWSRGWGDE